MCSWTNVQTGDDFDWLRSKGGTTSTFTGPSTDHTKGTIQGYYVFIETSNPRVPGDKARLASEAFTPQNTAACLSFYYNMNGVDIATLNTYILTNQTSDSFSSEALLWSLTGSAGTDWNKGQINVPTQYTAKPYQVKDLSNNR